MNSSLKVNVKKVFNGGYFSGIGGKNIGRKLILIIVCLLNFNFFGVKILL